MMIRHTQIPAYLCCYQWYSTVLLDYTRAHTCIIDDLLCTGVHQYFVCQAYIYCVLVQNPEQSVVATW